VFHIFKQFITCLYVLILRSYQRISLILRLLVLFRNMINFLRWRDLAQPPCWRTTFCQLSATAYLIYSQLPSISGSCSFIHNLRMCYQIQNILMHILLLHVYYLASFLHFESGCSPGHWICWLAQCSSQPFCPVSIPFFQIWVVVLPWRWRQQVLLKRWYPTTKYSLWHSISDDHNVNSINCFAVCYKGYSIFTVSKIMEVKRKDLQF
jgi:hypothetical protein